MLQKKAYFSTEDISREISHFTVGFAALSVKDHVEDATSAGSGTLVTIGSVEGILTAAHVVEALPIVNAGVGHPRDGLDSTMVDNHTVEPSEGLDRELGDRFRELHPDVSFAASGGGQESLLVLPLGQLCHRPRTRPDRGTPP